MSRANTTVAFSLHYVVSTLHFVDKDRPNSSSWEMFVGIAVIVIARTHLTAANAKHLSIQIIPILAVCPLLSFTPTVAI